AGRLIDRGEHSWLTGMREIARIHQGEFRLTCNQNLIIANVAAAERVKIDALVAAHRLDDYLRTSGIRRDVIACVALPTCGLAIAESERYVPVLVPRLEAMLDRLGLLNEPVH